MDKREELIERFIDSLGRVEEALVDHDPKMIRVWRFRDAPPGLRSLSMHGGDEDWVAWVPAGNDGWVPWAQTGTQFGVCDVSEHELSDGSVVLIGAHA